MRSSSSGGDHGARGGEGLRWDGMGQAFDGGRGVKFRARARTRAKTCDVPSDPAQRSEWRDRPRRQDPGATPMPDLAVLPLEPKTAAALRGLCTATLTTVLLKKGLRNVWLRGTRPLQGRAARGWSAARSRCASCRRAKTWPRRRPGARRSPPARAIEAMPAGCIAVVGAMGVTDAGIFGDILCARMHKRGVAGAGHRRRGARRGRRARHRPAGLVPGRGGAALGGRPDLRGLAGADRLRRRGGVPQRRDRRRRRRRGADPGGAARRGGRRGRRAGAARGLDHGAGRRPVPPCPACTRPTPRTRRATRQPAARLAEGPSTPVAAAH